MAEWLSARFEICRSRVEILFWPLADVVLGGHEFNFSAHSQIANWSASCQLEFSDAVV